MAVGQDVGVRCEHDARAGTAGAVLKAADLKVQVGEPLPSSMTPRDMPNSVTQQVPETKNYKFVKLPDRVLMVDATDRSIVEIIPNPTTTGAAPSTPSRR